MRVTGGLAALLLGTGIVIVQPVATALTPSEIANVARQITVRIDGANTGSGVIIERQGNVYTVVTNWHVVQLKGNYTVQTPDGQRYTFNNSQVKRFPGVDLAVFQFTSNQNYRVADKGNSNQVALGTNISVAGYPQGTSSIRFLRGSISSLESNPKEGYAFVYDVGGFTGMSGGAILDEQGKLVGIHGRANTRTETNATTVYGIPLRTYISLAPSVQPVASASTPSKINPQNAQAYYNQGVIYYEQKKWELALADFNKAIAINPQDADFYISRGNVYYEQKKWELALADFNKAIAINPQDAIAYYNRGNIYYHQKKWELALADYNKAIAINPQDALAYYNRGNIYYEQKKWELALAEYNKAIAINPQDADFYISRGNVYYDQKKWELALAEYNKAIAINPQDADFYISRGNVYYDQKKWELALADFNKAIAINPQDAIAYTNRGVIYYHQKKWELALAEYNKSVAQDPKFWPAISNIGFIRYEQGDIEGAIRQWQNAVSIDQKAAEPMLALAVALYTKGNRQQGLAIGKQALSIDKRYRDIEFLKENLWGDRLLRDTRNFLQYL